MDHSGRPRVHRHFALLFLFLLTVDAGAEELLVDSAEELKSQSKGAAPGDVITLAQGDWKDVELIVEASGTAALPITIRAEQPGSVTVTGKSRLRLGGEHVVVTGLRFHKAWHPTALFEFRRDSKRAAHHCRLTDCEFVECHPPDRRTGFKYVSIYGRGNSVDHCRLQGKNNEGSTLVVWLRDSDKDGQMPWGGHSIFRNHFGPRPELGRNGGETIRIGDSQTAHRSANTKVEENLFEECNGEGEIVSNKSCDNTYAGNVFLRCSGALTLRHGHRCLVQRNLFLGEKARGSGGVRVIGRDHVVVNNYFERLEGDDMRSGLCMMNGIIDTPASGYDGVERAIIAHNTFYDCKRTILIGRDNKSKRQVAPKQCLFANNVFVSRRGPIVDLQSQPEARQDAVRWKSNFWYGDGELGIDPIDGLTRLPSAPLKKGSRRWSLHEGSSLIDTGWSLAGSVRSDLARIDLSGRPRDGKPDVGCDEWPWEERESVNKVGPSWSPVPLLR